jgi:hemerythrin-like domain-containing protein
MNPHDLLAADHAALRQQADALRAAVEKRSQKLADHLLDFQKAVQRHFKREDIYYRVLDDGKRVADRGLIHQLRNDHAAVVFTVESLAIRLRKNGLNPDWRTRFGNLMNVFLPHLDQEDTALFPIGRKLLSPSETDAMARQIESCE